MTTSSDIREIAACNELGECVLWDDLKQAFWWTDIEGCELFRYDPDTEELESWSTPYRLASFGLIDDDTRLIAAFDRGIAFYDVSTTDLEWLTPKSFLPVGHRLNDGRVDREGNFCVGSMVESGGQSTELGKLFQYSRGGALSTLISGVRISNGLAWSPDGSGMYHADSSACEINVYNYSDLVSGTASPRFFASTQRGVHPDGATVDASGRLWSANWGGASVSCYSPLGDTLANVNLPVSQPTCVAFGGADLDLMLVTSARQGLSPQQLAAEPLAGNAFLLRVESKGLIEPRFVSRR